MLDHRRRSQSRYLLFLRWKEWFGQYPQFQVDLLAHCLFAGGFIMVSDGRVDAGAHTEILCSAGNYYVVEVAWPCLHQNS